MPKPTRCPNPNCNSQEFELVHRYANTSYDARIIQCGTAIGAVNDLDRLYNLIGCLRADIAGLKSRL